MADDAGNAIDSLTEKLSALDPSESEARLLAAAILPDDSAAEVEGFADLITRPDVAIAAGPANFNDITCTKEFLAGCLSAAHLRLQDAEPGIL